MLLHLIGLVAITFLKNLKAQILIFRTVHENYTEKEQKNTGHKRQYSELQMGKSSP